MMYYILEGHTPKPVSNILYWSEWFSKSDRIVKHTKICDVLVSTVFLGVDYSLHDSTNSPILFETMIFGGKHDGYQQRYSTWNEAEKGHKKACKTVQEKINPFLKFLKYVRLSKNR